jgi:hypothetical protein
VLHVKALPGNPYDGHTLGGIIEATETLTGCPIERAYVDKGYRGHNASNPHRARRLRCGQTGVPAPIRHRARDRPHED